MNDVKRRAAIKSFVEYWENIELEEGQVDERGETQKFWLTLLRDILGVDKPEKYIDFEQKVYFGKEKTKPKYIDGYVKDSKVLIEHKSSYKSLSAPIKQSDGVMLTSYEQAKRYIGALANSKHPNWIVTCNFKEFNIYDMEKPNDDPEVIYLKDLEADYYRLQFLVDPNNDYVEQEQKVSLEAGRLVGRLYDALLKQYKNQNNEDSLKSLNILCVRLVFCFYAEDAGVFKRRNQFRDYLKQYQVKDFRRALIDVFKILATHEDKRDKYLDVDLSDFPYVNGGLFSDEEIEIPQINEEIRDIILNQASGAFDWREISPTIFGAVFESTLNPETRKSGGMHYTSVENIHKVIDPLFLDELREELALAKGKSVTGGARTKALNALHNKIANLKFLDPACGSGNFLTETYLCLRRIENEILKVQLSDSITWGNQQATVNQVLLFGVPIRVSLDQFYGIEINDFAVAVAKTALWIAESQMMRETEDIIAEPIPYLPLQTITKIREGNALRIDWESVVPKEELNYIIGNPPFVGHNLRNDSQKTDMAIVFGKEKTDKIDYVACWFYKAALLCQNTKVKTALVATNSLCQGVSVGILWKKIFELGVGIDFAWTTFMWSSQAINKAQVHVIVVGITNNKLRLRNEIFNETGSKKCKNINGYLLDAPNICPERRLNPIANVPQMRVGSLPRSSAFTIKAEERDSFIKENPLCEKWIKPYIGSEEFINNKERYCLWLKDANITEVRKCRKVMERVEKVRKDRLASPAATTRKTAETPMLFAVDAQPDSEYLVVPQVSSEKRIYIPIGFMTPEVIASNLVFVIPNATLFHFGILTSSVHNSWMRIVCGRLEMRYRYSKDIAYNAFPWCNPTATQRAKIEKTAQGILDARALYPDRSLADLYDVLSMPKKLGEAHKANDKAVMEAYGFSKKMEENEIVAELMKMYNDLVNE